jgi:GNAT superfamily N-acetyltransferase
MTHSGTTFRYSVEPTDRERVRSIVEATGFFTPAEVAVAVELVDERLAKGDASGYFFVFIERGGRTIGYASYGPIAVTAASFDLYWIAVEPSEQGHGFGRLLLAESERLSALAGGRRMYIETSSRERYAATRSFYERCGYRAEAVLKDFYDVGDDCVTYAREL